MAKNVIKKLHSSTFVTALKFVELAIKQLVLKCGLVKFNLESAIKPIINLCNREIERIIVAINVRIKSSKYFKTNFRKIMIA